MFLMVVVVMGVLLVFGVSLFNVVFMGFLFSLLSIVIVIKILELCGGVGLLIG